MKCSRCGAKGLTFGHEGLCDSCRWKKWAAQREREEWLLEQSKNDHPVNYYGRPHIRLLSCSCHSPTIQPCAVHRESEDWS